MTTAAPQAGPLLVNRSKAMEMLGIRDPRVINRLIRQGKIKGERLRLRQRGVSAMRYEKRPRLAKRARPRYRHKPTLSR